jgi:pimeloyl-ACP methyl ester carboxylesterase
MIPGARRLDFAGTAHAPFLTRADEFLAALEEFLGESEEAA